MQAVYHLVAMARDDHSRQQLSATVTVTVLVDDVNDHSPSFISPPSITVNNYTRHAHLTVLVSDHARPGTHITAVRPAMHPSTMW